MACASRSGQALVELILSLFLLLTFLAVFMNASRTLDRHLQKQRFKTIERIEWSTERKTP